MPAETAIETDGKIVAVLAGTMFRVELANKHLVLAHISGRMRKRFIRLTMGDRGSFTASGRARRRQFPGSSLDVPCSFKPVDGLA